jgi:hypothetical protein
MTLSDTSIDLTLDSIDFDAACRAWFLARHGTDTDDGSPTVPAIPAYIDDDEPEDDTHNIAVALRNIAARIEALGSAKMEAAP